MKLPAAVSAALGSGASAQDFAQAMFDSLAQPWKDAHGIGRDTYGAGEEHGFRVAAQAARELGLETSTDAAGNLYMRLHGRDRQAPGWLCGSHLDSVPAGGNYDGAAGVVAGLTVLHALRAADVRPARDITVMAIRGEEASSWYQGDFNSHIGSRAALGRLDAAELDRAVRMDSGRTMADDMRALGLQPPRQGMFPAVLQAADYAGYIELHIEQGPVLVGRGLPAGIVTAIRGSARARSARCVGEYAHSGAVPQELRRDAVLATAEFLHRMEEICEEARAAGADLVYTAGRCHTDLQQHSITKVPGEMTFSIDVRSQDAATLRVIGERLDKLAGQIAARRGVQLDLGPFNVSRPATMDGALVAGLREAADSMAIPAMLLPSGAGHDCQDFCAAGFRCAMIFVRNDRGSHNPLEAMAMDDFTQATRLLAWQLLT